MTSLMLVFMMQYVVSTKAGLVNYVQGDVNVRITDSVPANVPVKTGPESFAEILLNPGSFLRIGENSEVILDNTDLAEIAVTVQSGAAVIEASEVDPTYPLKITTRNLSVLIVESGLFKFENGKATIIAGTLETADSRIPIKKGWAVISKDNVYRSLKVAKNEPQTGLESWSQSRSSLMLAANAQTFQTIRRAGFSARSSSWMWAPAYGAWTYFPYGRTRSPYGSIYRSYMDINSNVGMAAGGGGNGADVSRPASGNNNGGFGSSGGSGSGGGYSPAADRPTYRESVPMKNAPRPGGPGGPGGLQ